MNRLVFALIDTKNNDFVTDYYECLIIVKFSPNKILNIKLLSFY